MNWKKEPLKIIKIGYDKWEVYKVSDFEYKYLYYPPVVIGADRCYRIVVKWNQETKRYNFNAEEYFEIYGSGGWSKWVDYSNEVREKLFTDAATRIGKK